MRVWEWLLTKDDVSASAYPEARRRQRESLNYWRHCAARKIRSRTGSGSLNPGEGTLILRRWPRGRDQDWSQRGTRLRRAGRDMAPTSRTGPVLLCRGLRGNWLCRGFASFQTPRLIPPPLRRSSPSTQAWSCCRRHWKVRQAVLLHLPVKVTWLNILKGGRGCY